MMGESVRLAVRELVAHRRRSLSTLSAVAVGAAAIAFMMSLARSGEATLMQGIEAAGGRGLLIVLPKDAGASREGEVARLTPGDADALRSALGDDVEVFRLTVLRGQVVEHGRTRFRVDVGVGEHHRALMFPKLLVGRDVRVLPEGAGRKEIVVSHGVARRLFGEPEAALGAQVLLRGHGYEVVGVAAPEVLVGFQLVPLSVDSVFVSEGALEGREGLEVPHFGLIRHGPAVSHAGVVWGTHAVLDNRHRAEGSFVLMDVAELLKSFDRTLRALYVVIGAIALLALVVAGAGIMNVSLASIQERLQEFGIRRAMGAPKAWLRRQVLLESLLLAGGGATFGCAVGFGLSGAVGLALEGATHVWQHRLEPGVALASIGTGVFVSLVFGAHPALVAGRLEIVACLRGGR